jgi:LPS O-antigen subunit length determinant protein (WzzB/FepE family)
LPPLAADIALFNRENINAFTVAGVYDSLISNLRSRGNRKTFFEKSGLLDEIMTTSGRETANKAAVFDGINKAIDVELIKFSKDKKTEEKIEQVAVVLQGSPPEFLASYINGFADFALQKTLDNLIVEANSQKTEIIKTLERKIVRLKTQAKKQRLDTIAQLEEQDQIKRADLLQQISALQLKAKITREFEIQRLTEADQLEVASITEKIKALKITAKDRRLDRIKQLKEALQIAMALGIQSRSLLTSHYNTTIENNQTIKQSNNQTIKQSNNQTIKQSKV